MLKTRSFQVFLLIKFFSHTEFKARDLWGEI